MKNRISESAYALRIALPYMVAGGLWILFSDRIMQQFVSDVDSLTALQTYKGWLYVLLSAVFVYLISFRLFRHLSRTTGRLHQSRQDLTETQRAMYTLMSNLPGMAYRCRNDHQWTMDFISDGCRNLTGYRREAILGSEEISYSRIIHEEDRDMVWQQVQAALDSREAFQLEYRIRTRDGRIKWVWEQGCGVFSPKNELLSIEGYIFDVTERHQMQDELNDSQRLTHIGQAASTIIHDLKSPMQVILGHIELLRSRNDNPRAIRHFEIMEQQLHTMSVMSRELLDYARGETILNRTEENVIEFLDKVVETYQPTFATGGVQLTHVSRCATDESPLLSFDHEKIWRALMNLIGNAREAMPDGGEIHLRSTIDKQCVRVEIEDTGPGIPQQIQPTLFDPFVTFGKSHGTGLGLAITKKIVEAHRGTLTVESTRGAGATFTLTIPRVVERNPRRILEEGMSLDAPTPFRQPEHV